jgi:transcriptional regulator with XRE-family HTH domain
MSPADRARTSGETRVAAMRLLRNLTQTQLAERSGIPLRTLQRVERGEVADPSVRVILALADVLSCTVEELAEPAWRPRTG